MHSNSLHQLIISPSAHLILLKSGEVKHLVRKSVTSISALLKDAIKRPVYFIIRDMHSGAMYAELIITHDLSELADFLYNAWAAKDLKLCQLFGIPESLMVPKTIAGIFPMVVKKLSDIGINITYPVDGFSSGVRAVRTLEDQVRSFCNKQNISANDVNRLIETTIFSSNACPIGKDKSPFQIWNEGTAGISVTVPGNNREAFVNLLNP